MGLVFCILLICPYGRWFLGAYRVAPLPFRPFSADLVPCTFAHENSSPPKAKAPLVPSTGACAYLCNMVSHISKTVEKRTLMKYLTCNFVFFTLGNIHVNLTSEVKLMIWWSGYKVTRSFPSVITTSIFAVQ